MPHMAVLTPIWKPRLSDAEEGQVRISVGSLTDSQHWFIAPENLDTSWYQEEFEGSRISYFAAHNFTSVKSYSLLMTFPDIYHRFQQYEFVTICQTDALLLRDPTDIDSTQLDYIGAPWDPPLRYVHFGKRLYVSSSFGDAHESRFVRTFGRLLKVGNGGLSLRRTEALIHVTQAMQHSLTTQSRENVLEDALLCAIGPKYGLRIASRGYAQRIFMESQASHVSHIPSVFGFHGLSRWNPELLDLILNR